MLSLIFAGKIEPSPIIALEKIRFCVVTRSRIHNHNTPFSYILKHGPNKLEFYIWLGWTDLLGAKTLAFWAHSEVMKIIKCCEYGVVRFYQTSYAVTNLCEGG